MKKKKYDELREMKKYVEMTERIYYIVSSGVRSGRIYYIKQIIAALDAPDDLDDVIAQYIKDMIDSYKRIDSPKAKDLPIEIEKIYKSHEADEHIDEDDTN